MFFSLENYLTHNITATRWNEDIVDGSREKEDIMKGNRDKIVLIVVKRVINESTKGCAKLNTYPPPKRDNLW